MKEPIGLDHRGKNGMRSRVVAQQLNWAKRDDITQNTLLLVTARLLVSKASSFRTQDWARSANAAWSADPSKQLDRGGSKKVEAPKR